jgi:CheY-like chemotaxis protein
VKKAKSIRKFSEKCNYLCHHNILLVDDENMNIMMLFALFSNLSFNPIVANNAMEATKIFQRKLRATCCLNKFELIMTDIQMPEIDGLKFAQMIRGTEESWAAQLALKSRAGRLKSQHSCPIIAVTAHQDHSRKSLEEAGIDGVIYKPVQKEELVTVIRQYLFSQNN